jgi:serine protease Do
MGYNQQSTTKQLVIILLFGLLLISLSIDTVGRAKRTESSGETIVLSQEEAVTRVVNEVGRAVVSVTARKEKTMEDLFSNRTSQQSNSLGSGIIISKQGYILTDYQVVKSAPIINVKLSTGRRFKAELIGTDRQTDLAVIKIEADNLAVAPLGDSNQIRLGQLAIAIGSPYDLELRNTVTTGVITSIGRKAESNNLYQQTNLLPELIQTDTAINPGNSGGPLLDSQGQVIGIYTEVLDNRGGISFSIPINRAKKIVDDLINYGKVKRPWMGVYGTQVSQELKDYYALESERGVMVFRVIIDSPAEKAGLEKGDIILEANRTKITSMKMLNQIIKRRGIDSELRLLVKKDREDWRIINVELVAMPGQKTERNH